MTRIASLVWQAHVLWKVLILSKRNEVINRTMGYSWVSRGCSSTVEEEDNRNCGWKEKEFYNLLVLMQ